MKSNALTSLGLMLVFLSVSVAACRTTQSPHRQVDDTAIKVAVKTKLAADVRLSTLTNIDVDVTNGVVSLAGQVHNDDERRFAAEVAASCDGVRKVNNNLQVEHH